MPSTAGSRGAPTASLPSAARFDGEVDAFLILVLSVVVSAAVGWWVLVAGLVRYAFWAAARALPWMRRPLPFRYWRKVVTATVGITLAVAAAGVLPSRLDHRRPRGVARAAGRVVRAGRVVALAPPLPAARGWCRGPCRWAHGALRVGRREPRRGRSGPPARVGRAAAPRPAGRLRSARVRAGAARGRGVRRPGPAPPSPVDASAGTGHRVPRWRSSRSSRSSTSAPGPPWTGRSAW